LSFLSSSRQTQNVAEREQAKASFVLETKSLFWIEYSKVRQDREQAKN
jgi:hypothetical protein